MDPVARMPIRCVGVALLATALGGCGGGDTDNVTRSAAADRRHTLAVRTPSATQLFDWAERAYSQYFPGHKADQTLAPYTYRYYPETGNYVGVSGDSVAILGPISAGNLLVVGRISDFACQVFPSDCPRYGLSGTISGLTASGLVLANGAVVNSIDAFDQTFSMGSLPTGASYDIVVQSQPAGLYCQVTNGSGVVRFSVIANVSVACGPSGVSGWAWMSGAGGGGTYGTQGLAAPGNMPGVRANSASWIDKSGNFWLFGGASNSGPRGQWNDLWRYSPATGLWTWMSGSSTSDAVGFYGSIGVAAAGNVPGARAWASSWTDSSGNFWLFGGAGRCWFNDLWKYDPSARLWTWVAGPSSATSCGGPGVYGTQGVPSASNVPARRTGAVSWIDGSGNLWLFGGEGLDGFLNDLWMYSPATGLWVWVSGSKSAGAGGVYGTRGIAGPNSVPGARAWAVGWTDGAGSLWLHGGNANRGQMNDLWTFSPQSGMWTWVSGSSGLNAAPVYGTKGVAAVGNDPGGKSSASSWVDSAGNFWLFGGGSNDLWKYSPSTGTWTWTSGSKNSNAVSSGIQGLPAPTNAPGDRHGAITWIDSAGYPWLFGGSWSPAGQLTYTNELWRYTP